jgi:hypothetical protein
MLHLGFRIINKATAKALLESKTIPHDPEARSMLGFIGETEST